METPGANLGETAPPANPEALLGPIIATGDLAPGLPAPERLPSGVLASAVDAYERGDLLLARRELDALIGERRVWGADRLGAHFLLGWINARLGHHQQASANFYRVRKAEDYPLTEYAAFLEAKADLNRGHPQTAVKECDVYLETWPNGRWADECRLVQADANVAQGLLKAAVKQYEAFLEENPDDQRQEAISLRIAEALEQSGNYEAAGRRYRALYLHHSMPVTGTVAAQAIARLEASGAPLPPITDDDLYVRACSLRRAGLFDASYDLYCDLDDRNPADGEGANALGQRLDRERHEFLWRNRRYEEVGSNNAWVYDRNPAGPEAGEHAYWAMQGFARSGRFADAVKYQLEGMLRHGRHRRFRNTEERLALLYMGAAMYPQAREAWQAWAKKSSRARRSSKVKFNIAYTAYRSKDYDTAKEELEELAAGRTKMATAAKYYLGKVLLRQEEWRESRRVWNQIVDDRPDDWYAQVITNRRHRASKQPAPVFGRNGAWPGGLPGTPDAVGGGTGLAQAVPAMWRPPAFSEAMLDDTPPRRGPDGRVLRGELARAASATPSTDGMSRADTLRLLQSEHIPPTWRSNERWDRAKAWGSWEDFAEDHAEAWPELPVAYELSRVGLGEIAGPMVAAVHEQIRKYRRSKSVRRQVARWKSSGGKGDDLEMKQKAAAQDIRLKSREWMAIFSGAGYPARVSAFATDSIPFRSIGRETEDARATWTLAYPAAFSPQVWRAAWQGGVDPLLMLSIMRAESLYRHDAVSRVGALGLVQVMPATGSKVAALSGMEDFRVERLLEPAVNIEVGTWYMGKLLERFGPGQFPLAVGSYNGGPHNIGRWLKAKVGADLEDFVEEVAFDETRHYIKKVTRFYAVYADLYGGGAPVLLPERTIADDASVIDF